MKAVIWGGEVAVEHAVWCGMTIDVMNYGGMDEEPAGLWKKGVKVLNLHM